MGGRNEVEPAGKEGFLINQAKNFTHRVCLLIFSVHVYSRKQDDFMAEKKKRTSPKKMVEKISM